jgi:hypothetical protein
LSVNRLVEDRLHSFARIRQTFGEHTTSLGETHT